MTTEEKKEQVVQMIADLMRTSSFSVEYRVKKKPKGVKIVIEMTQEEMNCLIGNAAKKQIKTTDVK